MSTVSTGVCGCGENVGNVLLDQCVQRFDRWGEGSVHVWAGISEFNSTDLVFLNGNVNAQKSRTKVRN